MITVRLMREEDTDAVREVDAVAFWTWVKEVYGASDPMPRRTRTNVLACRERDPEGCFVAQEDSRVVGFIFSRTWGGAGWFGTFAVLPEYQGRRIGKQLIATSLDYLRQVPGRLIGLETMSESPNNLGLYLRLGFQARLPTFIVGKALEQSAANDADFPRWSSAGAKTQERWLVELREATSEILPGLDYSKEIVSTARHGLGETLVLLDGVKAIGMSIVRLTSNRENSGQERASVRVMTMHPAYTDEATFRAFLDATETFARAHGRQEVTMAVNSRHTWALERLLQWGYRVERMAVYMVLKGTDDGPRTDHWVDFSRWAG